MSSRCPSACARTTVWLGARPLEAPSHDALVNLGEAAPNGFEIVSRG